MKNNISIVLLCVALLLAACAPKAETAGDGDTVLIVTDGSTQVSYTAEDLQALGAEQATFQDVTYLGVPLTGLLLDAGFDPETLRAVKVKATDGYTVNYEPEFFLLPDTLVSYARLDGPLADDEVPFRMVLPQAEGKMNIRQIIEIEVIP
jgi:DMSO/TMAO reductase YedYZ molybdopterin-dependent catalytic subunit